MDRIATSLIGYGYRGLGLRGAYRGIRVLHWQNTDRRDPAGVAGRNAVGGARDRTRREWGGRWERAQPRAFSQAMPGLPAVTALPYNLNEWHPNNPDGTWNLLKPRSPHDLNEYNSWVVREVIYRPAAQLMERIVANGPGPALYRGLTSEDPDKVSETMKSIISLYTNNWHRAEQMKWFLDKQNQLLAAGKQEENIRIMKIFLQGYFQALHKANDWLNEFMQKLLALIGKMSG